MVPITSKNSASVIDLLSKTFSVKRNVLFDPEFSGATIFHYKSEDSGSGPGSSNLDTDPAPDSNLGPQVVA